MKQRFEKTVHIGSGFLFDASNRGKYLYLDPITGEALKIIKDNLYHNTGYPGTSLWYRAPLPGRPEAQETPAPTVHEANLALDEEGFLIIVMRDGRTIDHGKTRRFVHLARDIEKFRGFMLDEIKRMNQDIKMLLDVHLQAIAPNAPKTVYPEIFYEPYPRHAPPGKLWMLALALIIVTACFLLPQSSNPLAMGIALGAVLAVLVGLRHSSYKNVQRAIKKWEKDKQQFEARQEELLQDWHAACKDCSDYNAFFYMALDSFDWPRPTSFTFQLNEDCTEMHVDMDLPCWDDLPYHTWKVGRDNVTLERGKKDDLDRRSDYLRHVHSLLFLAASCAFWAVPNLETLYLSGYAPAKGQEPAPTPEKNKKKGKEPLPALPAQAEEEPEFLLSLKIDRANWSTQNFDDLERIDPVQALEQFELRRDLNKETLVLSPIVPFE